MSWLLFLDESGHDHKNAPYEVRGGIALHAGKLWPFVQAMKNLEESCFGDALHFYRTEIKGHRLLDKNRFQWAQQGPLMDDVARRKHSLAFFNKGVEKKSPSRAEFTAYGQACLLMARELFPLLKSHDAVLFAAVVPRNVSRPETNEAEVYLRKDQVFLLERFFLKRRGTKVCWFSMKPINPMIGDSCVGSKRILRGPSLDAREPNGSCLLPYSCRRI